VKTWCDLPVSGLGSLNDEVGGQARHELDGARLDLGGEPDPDLGGRDDGIGVRSLEPHKNTSHCDARGVGILGVILTRIGRGRWGMITRAGRASSLTSPVIEELEDPTEAVEIQEVARRAIALVRGEVIGAAQGDGGMSPVRVSDDEIRINPPAETDDLDALSAEGMMGMGDGDESRRGLG
jgi:hypothetical protein